MKSVHEWIRENRLNFAVGEHDYVCAVKDVAFRKDLEIVLRIKSRPGRTQLNIRRQQILNNLNEVISKALQTKIPKLVAQTADKRVLILERQHMNLLPEQIIGEIRKQDHDFPQMKFVSEIWLLETIGYTPYGGPHCQDHFWCSIC